MSHLWQSKKKNPFLFHSHLLEKDNLAFEDFKLAIINLKYKPIIMSSKWREKKEKKERKPIESNLKEKLKKKYKTFSIVHFTGFFFSLFFFFQDLKEVILHERNEKKEK